MNLYTFFLEYAGGTYISQVYADDMLEAPTTWLETLNQEVIVNAGADFKHKLLESLEMNPTPLEDIENTWSFSGLIDDNLALIHFTQTVKEVYKEENKKLV